ncbi:MAG: hypothetical protein G01um101493_13, partial [Microgenomates group bacterium Gr01-1014_93]
RLDLRGEPGTAFEQKADEAFDTTGYLKFLVEESDDVAEQLGDEHAETYSRMAARVGEIVGKYIAMAPRWDALVRDVSKQYTGTLKRFFSTSQGVAESFLAKVIEKTEGIDARNAFVEALDNQGFEFAEGYNIQIQHKSDNIVVLQISFHKEEGGQVLFDYKQIVPLNVVEDITHGS